MSQHLPLVVARAGTDAQVYILDYIAKGLIDSQTVRQQLAQLDGASTITVNINSGGGDVFESIAIFNLLREHDAVINTKVVGLAASGASVIAMAASAPKDGRKKSGKIMMAPGSMMMVHTASMLTYGNSDQLRKDAELLDKINASIAEIYQARTNGTPEQVAALLDNEDHWMTAEEALELGLVDEIIDQTKKRETVQAAFRAVAAAQATPPTILTTAKYSKSPKTMQLLAQHLGLSAEASEHSILEAIKQRESAIEAEAKTAAQAENLKALVATHEGLLPAESKALFEEIVDDKPTAAMKLLKPNAINVVDVASAIQQTPGSGADPNAMNPALGQPSASGIPADRQGWSLAKWTSDDPEGLTAMQKNNPQAFQALLATVPSK